MEIKTFKGNYFEIGKQQGKIYREKEVNFNLPLKPKMFDAQLKIYKKHYPELLEELKGIAEGGGFDEKKVINTFICIELLWATQKYGLQHGCTIIGVQNKNGFFVGRNFDWPPGCEKTFQAYKVINSSANSYITVTERGFGVTHNQKNLYYLPEDVINDKGLFISLLVAHHKNWSYGLSRIHINKLIGEKCSRVEEALEIFNKIPVCCPNNYFIADKHGKMAVVEHTSGKRFKIIYPENDVMIKTNHYLDPEYAKEDKALRYRLFPNTKRRYRTARKKIMSIKETFNFSDVIKILGDTKSPVCANKRYVKTIWTLALDMKNKKYKLYWDLFGKRKEQKLEI